MALCPLCIPWNAPLTLRALYTVDAGPVALPYEQWILYRLHVEQHQHGRWAGEIEAVTERLRANQTMTLQLAA